MGSDFDKTGSAEVENDQFSPVQVRKNRLLITNWETDDTETVLFFSNKPTQDRARAFERALKVGVVASNVVGTAERIDYVQKEFNSLQSRFNDKLDTTLRQLGNIFNDQFGDRGKFGQIMQETFGENGKLVKQIFDPHREGTPLFELKGEIERQIRGLRDILAERAGAEKVVERTTLHGFVFEDEVEQMLNKIVKQRRTGDTVRRTSNEIGKLTRNKEGDFVLRLAVRPDTAVVIETKDEKMTLPRIQQNLKEAMENRAATYGIFVSKKVEDLPDFMGWFCEYPENQLVIALGGAGSEGLREEILDIAIAWARLKVMLESAKGRSINVAKMTETVTKAETTIARFRDIITQCTNLDNATQKIRGLCDEIKRDLQLELATISLLVNTPMT